MTNNKPKMFLGTFEDYTTVGDPVGNGGSGTVFKVRTSDGDILALKLLDRSKTPRAKLKRFRNELQFCSQPRSKHIIHVIDSGRTDDGSIFYVMRFYPKTVRNLIRDRLPQGELLPLYSQILDGAEAAHLLRACHRDIKPENLLYDSDAKQIVLADFGIARFVADELLTVVETGPNERLANFAYAAPEQRLPGKDVDQRADIYALGLILNELFTGEVPQGTGFRKIKDVAPSLAYLDGVRGTNAQKYGYGGNTLDWQARAFGAIAFPIPFKNLVVITPTFEVDQEPNKIKYIPTARLPTDLIYAVRFSRLPDSRWSFDIGTGHVGANLGPGINIKANNAIAFAANFRFR
jgi:serine/threonine protein kinase